MAEVVECLPSKSEPWIKPHYHSSQKIAKPGASAGGLQI
jgi:hypothetical protein